MTGEDLDRLTNGPDLPLEWYRLTKELKKYSLVVVVGKRIVTNGLYHQFIEVSLLEIVLFNNDANAPQIQLIFTVTSIVQ